MTISLNIFFANYLVEIFFLNYNYVQTTKSLIALILDLVFGFEIKIHSKTYKTKPYE